MPFWIFHLSTITMLFTIINIVTKGKMAWWSFWFTLMLLCTSIVLFTPQCDIQFKYHILALKTFLLISACLSSWKHAKFSVYHVLYPTIVSIIYILSLDIKKLYGCSPNKTQYVSCYIMSIIIYGFFALLHCILKKKK